MRYILLLVVSFSTATAQLSVQDAINQVNLDTLTQNLNEISGEVAITLNGSSMKIGSRGTTKGKDTTRAYLLAKLSSYGLAGTTQSYSTGKNIYAVQTGSVRPHARYIICSHFDAMATYCADDDGTGIGAVMEAARIISKTTTSKTIVYVFFDEEEGGEIGSDYYVNHMSPSDTLLGVIDIEMCGYDSDNDSNMEYHTDANGQSLVNSSKAVNTTYSIGLLNTTYSPSGANSDYDVFFSAGYKAICISEFFTGGDTTPYYHSSSDRVSTLRMSYYQKNVKLGVGTILDLVGSVASPTTTYLMKWMK